MLFINIINLNAFKSIKSMADKIVSPKIEIINHYDNLIQRVDIDIEECLKKYNEDQVIGDLKCYKTNEIMTSEIRSLADYRLKFKLCESSLNKSYENGYNWLFKAKMIEEDILLKDQNNENENPDDLKINKIYKTVDLWSEKTNVVDYLNQVRMGTIEELRKAQEEALESYKSQKDHPNRPDKFYFQVLYKQSEPEEWIFKLFTFVTDFYMSPIDINLLE